MESKQTKAGAVPDGPVRSGEAGERARSGAARADVLSGGVLVLLGSAAAIGALQMPRQQRAGPLADFLTYPGTLPLLVGLLVAIGGLAILWQGWRAGRSAPRGWRESLAAVLRTAGFRRGAGLFGIILLYVGILMLGVLPFWVATYLYLAVTMVWLRASSLGVIIGVSLAVAVALELGFGMLLRLPLP